MCITLLEEQNSECLATKKKREGKKEKKRKKVMQDG